MTIQLLPLDDSPTVELDKRALPPAPPLDLLTASAFAGRAKPVRQFLCGAMFPLKQVSLVSGDGGVGKSLLLLQLAVATCTGGTWLGMHARGGPALVLSAEDDGDELHLRLRDICAGEGFELEDLDGLHLAILAGKDALLATEKGGSIDATNLYRSLETSIRRTRPALVVLDNLADIFGGNEIVRGQARQFIGLLRHLAITYDCAVVVLAHPSLQGISSGTGASGNTAWSNSVRFRAYLKRQHDDPAEVTDPFYRKLCVMKDNAGPTGGEIGMRWEAGRFVATDTPSAAVGIVDRVAAASKAERVFLRLVETFNAQGRNVSPSTSASYAPVLFAKHPDSEGVSKRQFEQAMETLLSAGRIRIVETGPASKRRKNIEISGVQTDD